MKRVSPIAVFVGAIPGALPPLIGYFAAFNNPSISWLPVILFIIQFVWQFPHFWAIAWVLDDDYKKAGFRLLPTTNRDKTSAAITLVTTLLLIPVGLMPVFYNFGGYVYGGISIIGGVYFTWQAIKLFSNLNIGSAKKLMYASFFYLPLLQLALLFDLIAPGK